jgi:pyruvate,water dikinase
MLVGTLFKHWSLRLLAPDRMLRLTYETFKTLLGFDIRSHDLMAEFAELYYEGRQEDLARTRARYRQLAEAVAGMVHALEQMLPGRTGPLHDYFNKYDFYIRLLLAPPEQFLIPPFVVNHDTLTDAALVGHKSAHLLQLNTASKVRVPPGFTITTTTFALLVEHNRLRPAIDLLLADIDPESSSSLEETSQALIALVRRMAIPHHVAQAITAEYDRLASLYPGGSLRVAVRSSAMHEDGKHSFAGQYHSVLGVARSELLAAYLEVVASKYSPQALLYRIYTGLGDEEAAMAVLVLVMVDAVASGVVYTRDPSAVGDEAPLLVQSIQGLGLPLVGGETIPDVYKFPPQSATPTQSIAGCQHQRLVVHEGRLHEEQLDANDRISLSLSREQAVLLAATARELETFFGGPQDIEWALDRNQELYILQSRPLHIEAAPQSPAPTTAVPDALPLLVGAKRAAGGVACGIVHHLNPMDTAPIQQGAVLVTRHIPPSLVRFIGRLEAVVCEQGAVTGHFATVCREFGVILLVGATEAAAQLPAGTEVTVDGYNGIVYAGKVASLLECKGGEGVAANSDFSKRLRALLDYITPLHLVDPNAPNFQPQSTRSLHDIIRYAHEKAVQAMFGLSDIAASGTSSHCLKLETDLPIDIYLLDVGGAYTGNYEGGETIALNQLKSSPFVAIWQGLSHPDIDWKSHSHFDWQGFSDMALSGGIASSGSKDYASYAVVSMDYLNLNMRFGYHFTLVDCVCGEEPRANYCQVRFAGGGGDYQGRSMRVILISRILRSLGFEVNIRGDLLDARLTGYPERELCSRLSDLGRLLGMTKLLDMVLQDQDIDWYAEQFSQGAGRFSSRPDSPVNTAG